MTDAAGSVNIGATASISLSLSVGYQPVPGDQLFVLTRADGGAFVNPFANALEGSTVTLAPGIEGTITYSANWVGNQLGSTLTGGNDIAVLVTIPEPARRPCCSVDWARYWRCAAVGGMNKRSI
jgi:hypothetical protein